MYIIFEVKPKYDSECQEVTDLIIDFLDLHDIDYRIIRSEKQLYKENNKFDK